MVDLDQHPDSGRKKRVEQLYRGFGIPAPVTRSLFFFRWFVTLGTFFTFGFEKKDLEGNVLLARLWRWSVPAGPIALGAMLEAALFAGASLLKYRVYTAPGDLRACLLFVLGRGLAWGWLLGLTTFMVMPWAVARWRKRQVLGDMRLTALSSREVLAALLLPPLYLLLLPALVFSLLDFLVVPLGYLYLTGRRPPFWTQEAATLLGLPFEFSMIYMHMMIVFAVAFLPVLRERSVSMAVVDTFLRTLRFGIFAVLKFVFNVFFILLLVFLCFGWIEGALLVYGTWWGFSVCDGLIEKMNGQLHEADRHWWNWMSGGED
ncbi:MAG: hypothetical protein Kow0059_13450 [Candidatus Sumerlaeia bacterium]